MRPAQPWGDVVRVLNRTTESTWTVERLRRTVRRLVAEGIVEAKLLDRAPRQQSDDRLLRLVAGIAAAAPDRTLQQIASQLEAHARAHATRRNIGGTPPPSSICSIAPNSSPWSGQRQHRLIQRSGDNADQKLWDPYFTKDLTKARKPLNARSETIAGSGMFRVAFAKHRCLVPPRIHYEWRDDPDGKTPFAVARVEGVPVAFGAIWEERRSPTGEKLQSFAAITIDTNTLLAQNQDRMPVIIEWADGIGPNAKPGWPVVPSSSLARISCRAATRPRKAPPRQRRRSFCRSSRRA